MKASPQFQKKSAAPVTPIPLTTNLFRAQRSPAPTTEAIAPTTESASPNSEVLSRVTPDWNRIFSNSSRPATVQPKLTVGAPNDVYEQEADRVADQVMSMPDSATQQPVQREAMPEEEEVQTKPLAASITPLIQREAMPEEEEALQTKASGNPDIQRMDNLEEEDLQTKPIASMQREEMPEEEEVQTKAIANTLQREEIPEEEEPLQMKRSPDGSLEVGGSIETQLNNGKGGGSPLPDEVRSFMEPRFGANFSGVKVHTDAQADQLNRSVQARAFTTGQDVFFRQGEYDPGSRGGQELIAHELTHVVQQNRDISVVQRSPFTETFKQKPVKIKKIKAEKMPFSVENVMDNPEQKGTQQMVPGGPDLEELKNILDPESDVFRPEWKDLTPNQAWALLAAERKGKIQVPEDKKSARRRLQELNATFQSNYPISDDEETDAVLEKIAKHIASRPIATNFNLSAPPGANRMTEDEIRKSPKTLVEILMEDKDGVFRTVWETNTSQASADLHSRGAVEEMFGYGSAVGRKTGKYQNFGDKSSSFDPEDAREMPKYGALVSVTQKAGVAPRYGSSIIYWKEELRSRVTHTPSDSWGMFGGRFYTSNTHPLPLVAYGDVYLVRLMAAEATEFQFDPLMREEANAGLKGMQAYFETQIHGNLSWDDVDRIVLNWGVFKNPEGKPLPNTSKEHAEALLSNLQKFAEAHNYDFRVQLGQEFK